MLFQLHGKMRQPFNVRRDFFPTNIVMIPLDLPSFPVLSALALDQILVIEKETSFHVFVLEILRDVRSDAVLCRVDLKPGQDRQKFRFFPILFAFRFRQRFVVGNDRTVERGVADLSDTGCKGIAHRFKARMPVVCVRFLRRYGRALY